jgi:predicted flap endonuclease-1-like 5' DNA nuclease
MLSGAASAPVPLQEPASSPPITARGRMSHAWNKTRQEQTMANKKIEEIEGIGPVTGEKLHEAGVKDTDSLLEQGCTQAGRKTLAEASGLSESQILKFVNMADLFRIKGVAGEYAELLECSGVDTVKELRTRNAENLAEKLAEVNAEKNLTRKVPTLSQVEDWVKQAADLPPKVTH